jgi:hypothetical protein
VVRYSALTEPTFATQAAATFSVDLLPTVAAPVRIILSGLCPRCSDPTTHTHPLFITKSIEAVDEVRAQGLWELVGEEPPDEWNIPVSCACSEPHEGRPIGATGCGAYWGMTVERQRRQTP